MWAYKNQNQNLAWKSTKQYPVYRIEDRRLPKWANCSQRLKLHCQNLQNSPKIYKFNMILDFVPRFLIFHFFVLRLVLLFGASTMLRLFINITTNASVFFSIQNIYLFGARSDNLILLKQNKLTIFFSKTQMRWCNSKHPKP